MLSYPFLIKKKRRNSTLCRSIAGWTTMSIPQITQRQQSVEKSAE
jgi:hypothetical protein